MYEIFRNKKSATSYIKIPIFVVNNLTEMKSKILFVILLSMLSTQVEGQDILRKIGKSVGNSVKKEIVRKIKESNSSHQARPQQHSQVNGRAPETQHEKMTQETVVSKSVVRETDEGQNIIRDTTLNYIDEYGINHGGGILIGGILWAPVNCGYHATDYPYGKLFQWGRKHGQGYGEPYANDNHRVRPDSTTADIVPAPVTPAEARKHPNNFYARSDYALFNWTDNDMKLWNQFTDDGIVFKNKLNDPCPEGWRLPELFDFYNLTKNYSEFTEYHEGGQKGRWFSGPEPYGTGVQRIFLPAVGSRDRAGISMNRDISTGYWTLRHGGGEGLIWTLYFGEDYVEVSPHAFPHEANAVRCVKDIEGQRML